MINAVQLESQTLNRGRPTKFTPERIRQISNLVERGKNRDEIAEIIGVTTGTLQVTCSKLGISLRRPVFDTGVGLLHRQRAPYQKTASPNQLSSQSGSMKPDTGNGFQPVSGAKPAGEVQAGAPPTDVQDRRLNDRAPPVFAIRMEYKGQEQSTSLPLNEEMIGRLAIEAEIRGMRIGELVAAFILAIVKKDLFHLVRDDARANVQRQD
jgi:hypothetical protein